MDFSVGALDQLRSVHFFVIQGRLRRASPRIRKIYPAGCNKRRRAIHRLDNANSVSTCAAFLAKPRCRTLVTFDDLRQRVADRNVFEWTVVVVAFLIGLAASPYVWRGALESVAGVRISIAAARWQTMLLVTGKYVPGQMIGVAARMAATDGVSARVIPPLLAVAKSGVKRPGPVSASG